jgi:molecular chaperone GrpE
MGVLVNMDEKGSRDTDASDSDENDMEDIEVESVVNGSERQGADANRFQDTAALRDELEKSKNDLLYLRAEFDNYKKRALKERSDYLRYAGEQAFVGILDVLDNFERALQTDVTPENFESFKKGVELIAENLKSTLRRYGVTEVPSEGVPFDPNMHEAISSQETDSIPPGHVAQVFRKTYKMHDRVIRPGQVIVAKPKSEKKD